MFFFFYAIQTFKNLRDNTFPPRILIFYSFHLGLTFVFRITKDVFKAVLCRKIALGS